MGVRPDVHREQYPPWSSPEEDDEDRLETVIMADRAGEDAIRRILRPGAAPVRRRSGPPVEAEGVLLEDEPTPETEHRHFPAVGLTPVAREWEVTEQMPMPSDMRRPPPTSPTLDRPSDPWPSHPRPRHHHAARARPVLDHDSPAHAIPRVDPTPELRRREWSEVSDTPETLSNQPTYADDDETSFASLILLLAVPAFAIFFVAMWLAA